MHRSTSIIALIIASGVGNAASAQQQNRTWFLPTDGDWNSVFNWFEGDIPDGAAEDAIIGVPGTYAVSLGVNGYQASVGRLVITNPNATFRVLASGALFLQGAVHTNSGTITINPTNSTTNAYIRFDQPARLEGTGTVLLNAGNDEFDAYVENNSNGILTLGAGQTIRGAGALFRGQWTNEGLVRGDISGRRITINAAAVTQTAAGRIDAVGGGSVAIQSSASVRGGTITAAAPGVIDVRNAASLREVTLDAPLIYIGSGNNSSFDRVTSSGRLEIEHQQAFFIVGGDWTHNGNIIVNVGRGANNTYLQFEQNSVLGGTGEIELRAATTNINSAYVAARPGITVTIPETRTIRGAGTMFGRWINRGTIAPDLVTPTQYPMELRNGSMTQLDNGKIEIRGATALGFADFAIDGGSITATAAGASVYKYSSAASLTSLTLDAPLSVQGQLNIDRVTSTGTITLENGGWINQNSPFGSTWVHNGDILINRTSGPNATYIFFDQTGALGGTGIITLNALSTSFDTAYLSVRSGITLTMLPGRTIRGLGRFFGNYNIEGRIEPGFPAAPASTIGQFDFTQGTITLQPTSRTVLQFAGRNPGQFDRLTGGSTKVLGGTLEVVLLPGFTPTANEEIAVITGGPVSGSFSQIVVTGQAGQSFQGVGLISGGNEFRVRFVPTADLRARGNTILRRPRGETQ